MHADIQGALAYLRKPGNVYKMSFTHRDKPMTYAEALTVMEYADAKGYTSTEQLSDEEVDAAIDALRTAP